MPFEPIYGLPYEAGSDLPGWSLTGGPDGSQQILAEAVASQLRRLDDLIANLADSFGSYPDVVQAGFTTVTPDTSVSTSFYNSSYWRGSTAIVFDTPFESFLPLPSVFACGESTVPGVLIEVSVSDVTAEGCTINIGRSNTTTTGMHWIAASRTQT